MATLLHVLGLFALAAMCAASLVSLIFGLPGTFLIVGAALVYASATGFAAVRWSTVGWLLLLALAGEGMELFAAAAGAGGERPSTRVTIFTLTGGIVGGIAGAPFLLGLGSLLGALAGAFAGASIAVVLQGGTTGSALRTGLAAMRGRLLGFVLKSALAVAMVVIVAAAAL
jgi:hypothetical protein